MDLEGSRALVATIWSLCGALLAVAAALDWTQLSVIVVAAGMVVSATWWLGKRFSAVESRLTALETRMGERERKHDRERLEDQS